ncbi:MAG: alpha-ketoglutarate-dependent dioxygenase AlkB family protein [Cytophagales bacterium]
MINTPDAIYLPQFYSDEQSRRLLNELKNTIDWRQEKIKMFGKEILEPRLVAWYGDKTYKYSGKLMQPLPWTPLLLQIKNEVEKHTLCQFNAVLLNYYRNGKDSMGWHSDDEPTLGQNPNIASINFGQTRKFQFRLREKIGIKKDYLLENGSLLLMQGDTQHRWQHQLPKSTKMNGERINLTFRFII